MLLNVDTVMNDSKKISELIKLRKITKHQENSWLPMAQYNSRTNSYTNAAINLDAITSYNIEHTYAYIGSEFGTYWKDLLNVGTSQGTDNIGNAINNSDIANNIVGYVFTYTVRQFDWQIVPGSYIPGYYAPLHPDDNSERQAMPVPDFDNIGKIVVEEDIVDDELENIDNN